MGREGAHRVMTVQLYEMLARQATKTQSKAVDVVVSM